MDKTKKYNIQGQFAISKFWFNLDHEFLEENFITRELVLYKNVIKLILKFK